MEKEGDLIRSIALKSNIEWIPMSFTRRPPVISKIYDRYRMLQKAIKLYRKHKFNLVHCRSYVSAEVGLKLKKKYGVKFLFDMRGFWADEKLDNGQWDTRKIFFKQVYRHYKKKEREFLLNADGIISLTEAASDYLKKQPMYHQLPVDVIPCCADLEHFDFHKINADQKAELRERLGISSGKRIVAYLGSVGGWYMTREMFDFFKVLVQHYPDYLLLVLTKDDSQKVINEARQYGIGEHQLIVTYSDRKQLPIYLSLCESSIFFIRNSFSKIASSPTKHAELMGMGIPVICNDIGDTGRIIEKTQTGYIVPSFTEDEYTKAINLFSDIISINKDHIRASAMEYFDLKKGVSLYASAYRRILND